jgi:hypothetical protein
MRCIAVIEAQRPGLDSVLLWDRDGQLVAYAYLEGKVTMTRPLNAATLETGITEVLESFQINQGQATRITDWSSTGLQSGSVVAAPTRWE